jgi:hypothetical protein
MPTLTPRLLATLAAFAGFSFLLHFAWEILQAPLYSGMRDLPHARATWICMRATFGDIAIALCAYATAALAQRDPAWIVQAKARAWLVYLLTGLIITLVLEYLGTGPLGRWAYATQMWKLPGLGIGTSPLLQWLLLPPLAAWLTARHARR